MLVASAGRRECMCCAGQQHQQGGAAEMHPCTTLQLVLLLCSESVAAID